MLVQIHVALLGLTVLLDRSLDTSVVAAAYGTRLLYHLYFRLRWLCY